MFYIYLLLNFTILGFNSSYIFIPQTCLSYYSIIPNMIYSLICSIFVIYHFFLKKVISLPIKIFLSFLTALSFIYNCLFIIYLNVYSTTCQTTEFSPQLIYLIYLYSNNFMYPWFVKIIKKVIISDYNTIVLSV